MKISRVKRGFAPVIAGIMAFSFALTGCGSSSDSGGSKDVSTEEYTWLIDADEASYMYSGYEDNPIYKYWSDMEWTVDGTTKKISVDFMAPAAGSEKDNVTTLLATGEYPEIMSTSYSSEPVAGLYEEGIAIDLTDLVDQYMPNYKALIDSDPTLAAQVTNVVDGEKKILQLYEIMDEPQPSWCGYEYRRDWIVDYGTNPETGEAFSGSWNDDHTVWTDDVVFPSGNTDPVYISDWEWMMEIFMKALEDQGITDGYAMQLSYMGYIPMGDFTSAFGVSAEYYLDDDTTCQYGMTSDGMRAYLECMNTWYENGWIDKSFEENTADAMFWKVDTASVYSGKVGAWYGMNSSLGDLMDTSEGNETSLVNGIVVYGAPQPINDVYGDASVQNIIPTVGYSKDRLGASIILTNKIEDKDIGTILTAIDYLYGDEGGLLRSRGFSDEQQAEIRDEFYTAHGLDDGAYHMDGDTVVVNQDMLAEDGLETAARLDRIPGYKRNKDTDMSYADYHQHAIDMWMQYSFDGNIAAAVSGQLSADQSSETSLNTTNLRNYEWQEVPKFITGVRDISSDADWNSFVSDVEELHPYVYCDYLNQILGN